MKPALLAGLLALSACATAPRPPPVAPPPSPEAVADPRVAVRAALAAFVDAVEASDFAAALELLSQDWRRRYDAARLQRDFGLEPLGADRVRRLKAQLAGTIDLSGPDATLALGDGAAARLVLEQGGWRLRSLE